MRKKNYPGRLTREEWLALPKSKRHEIAKRAQCDLYQLFKLCTKKICRRARSCCGDPAACEHELWLRAPKKLRNKVRDEYVRIGQLPYA